MSCNHDVFACIQKALLWDCATVSCKGNPTTSLILQVVAETDEPFVPVPDELIVNLKESREAVEALLDNLANTFAATTSVRHHTHIHVA